ncbi:MAG: hypothetical protein K6G29_11415 [Clostridiales bacterium]|nr:hypothetical protein [Clostridiales bacterium]
MKPEKICEAIGELDDGILAETEAVRETPRKKPFRAFVRRWGTLAAAILIAAGGILYSWTHRVVVTTATYIAEPYLAGPNVYPNIEEFTVEDYLAWREETDERIADLMPDGDFAERSVAELFGASEGGNLFYSPYNAELSLVSLADMTAGQTRTQLLNVAGEEDLTDFEKRMENRTIAVGRSDAVTLRTTYGCLNYYFYIPEDEYIIDGVFDGEKLQSLVPMRNSSYDDNGLLRFRFVRFISSVMGGAGSGMSAVPMRNGYETIQIDPPAEDTIGIERYLYVRSAWLDPADPAQMRKSTFNGKSGECEADYVVAPKAYAVSGDGFSAVRIPLLVGGDLWLALPDEGTTPEDLLTAGALFSAARSGNEGTQTTAAVPRFSVASEVDLKDLFTALGADKAFIPGEANLSPFFGTDITAAEAAENRNDSLNALKEVQSKIENILGEAEDYFDAAAESGSAKPKQIMKKLKDLEETVAAEQERVETELRRKREKDEDEAAEKKYAVTHVNQPIRLAVDETGVKTAAYSLAFRAPKEEVRRGTPDASQIIDRPFAVLITAEDGTVLLAGAVNDITE